MKKIFILIITLVLFHQAAFSQKDSSAKKPEQKIKQFWLVILKTGPSDKEITDTAQRNKIFAGHFSNMERLYYDGILKAAGPFGKNEFTWRGLFILDCKSKEEAEGYVKTDPAVAAGVFITDIVPWFSEATGSFVPGKPKKDAN
ncbi:MAG: hypothetical protein IPQ06_04415 [Chitinophagaceae bacterium]|nr:hypothetical protein [Chitinophagaceae bacterium]MBL0272317.1 hypothetical protein [Chitinophagaceae bacterium]